MNVVTASSGGVKQHSQDNTTRRAAFTSKCLTPAALPILRPNNLLTSLRQWQSGALFKLRPDAEVPRLDLTIIDQSGARSHEAANGSNW